MTTYKYCPQCGHRVQSAMWNFCADCGNSLAPLITYPWISPLITYPEPQPMPTVTWGLSDSPQYSQVRFVPVSDRENWGQLGNTGKPETA